MAEVTLAAEVTRSRAPVRRRRPPRSRAASLLWHACMLAVLAVVVYPLAWLVSSAFKPGHTIIGDKNLLPTDATTENFGMAMDGIARVSAMTFFTNSLILSAGAVIGTVLSCSLTAYALGRLRFPGRKVMFVVMIATLLLPFHVMIIPQYIIFNELRLIDTYVPLLAGKYLAAEAFFVFLFIQFLRGIPRELDQAAKIDGAGYFRIYWNVLLPLMRPAIITAAIFTFIWTWNDFLGPLIYLNSPDKYPVSRALALYIDQEQASNYGALIAMSVLSLVPIMLFFLVFQRFLIRGIATSGLKG
jgi:multiple sugar transport system permease protein